MAFASIGTLGTSQEKTSDGDLALTTAAQLDAGNLGVIAIALDNTLTTDGASTLVSSVNDGTNAWVKLIEFTNGQGVAGDGATISVWYVVPGANLALGATITVTLGASVTAKSASAWEFTKGAGTTINLAGSATGANDGVDAAAIVLSGLPSKEYLFFHALAYETIPTDTYTEDADYTSITQQGTTGGGAATNMTIRGGFRIATLTGDTVDIATGNRDSAHVFLAIEELAAGGSVVPIIQAHNRRRKM